jgi:hypothetical protein
MWRDSAVLNHLYQPGQSRFYCIRIERESRPAGWVVVIDTQMRGHNHFNDMRVGTIVDQLSLPGEEVSTAAAGTSFLKDRGVDLIVSNQMHPRWKAALSQCGFLSGPSNFILARSKALTAASRPDENAEDLVQMTRGDGDGPWNL